MNGKIEPLSVVSHGNATEDRNVAVVVVTAVRSSVMPTGHSSLDKDTNNVLKSRNDDDECKDAIDYTSVRGIFGWATIDSIDIPYIMRKERKFVAVKIVEKKMVGKYLNLFSCELLKKEPLISCIITNAEARLLNEINSFHCSNKYGQMEFTTNDLIVDLQKFEEVYNLAKGLIPAGKFDHTNLSNSHNYEHFNESLNTDTGGWLQINNTVTPYIYRHGNIFVPVSVIKYAAQLLSRDSDDGDAATRKECTLLNTICRKAGVQFEFMDGKTKLIHIESVVSRCHAKVKFLPGEQPLQHAQYDFMPMLGNVQNFSAVDSLSYRNFLVNSSSAQRLDGGCLSTHKSVRPCILQPLPSAPFYFVSNTSSMSSHSIHDAKVMSNIRATNVVASHFHSNLHPLVRVNSQSANYSICDNFMREHSPTLHNSANHLSNTCANINRDLLTASSVSVSFNTAVNYPPMFQLPPMSVGLQGGQVRYCRPQLVPGNVLRNAALYQHSQLPQGIDSINFMRDNVGVSSTLSCRTSECTLKQPEISCLRNLCNSLPIWLPATSCVAVSGTCCRANQNAGMHSLLGPPFGVQSHPVRYNTLHQPVLNSSTLMQITPVTNLLRMSQNSIPVTSSSVSEAPASFVEQACRYSSREISAPTFLGQKNDFSSTQGERRMPLILRSCRVVTASTGGLVSLSESIAQQIPTRSTLKSRYLSKTPPQTLIQLQNLCQTKSTDTFQGQPATPPGVPCLHPVVHNTCATQNSGHLQALLQYVNQVSQSNADDQIARRMSLQTAKAIDMQISRHLTSACLAVPNLYSQPCGGSPLYTQPAANSKKIVPTYTVSLLPTMTSLQETTQVQVISSEKQLPRQLVADENIPSRCTSDCPQECSVAVSTNGTVNVSPAQLTNAVTDLEASCEQSSDLCTDIDQTVCARLVKNIGGVMIYGKIISCMNIFSGSRYGSFCLVEAMGRMLFPTCPLATLVKVLRNGLKIQLVICNDIEARAFIQFYKLPAVSLNDRHMISVTDLNKSYPKIHCCIGKYLKELATSTSVSISSSNSMATVHDGNFNGLLVLASTNSKHHNGGMEVINVDSESDTITVRNNLPTDYVSVKRTVSTDDRNTIVAKVPRKSYKHKAVNSSKALSGVLCV